MAGERLARYLGSRYHRAAIVSSDLVRASDSADLLSGGRTAIRDVALSALIGLAFEIWNQALRMARTGQSLGRRAVGITVVDAETGEHLTTSRALLKALVSGAAGLISALWMLLDDDARTLSDKVGNAAVIITTRGEA